MIVATVPPSADQAAPVTVEARSEHRNTITDAISSGRGHAAERDLRRLRGERLLAARSRAACAACSARPPAAVHSGEVTAPGATALTSTASAA